MSRTYDEVAAKFLETRRAIEALELETKKKLAPMKEALALMEAWFTAKAQAEGLDNIKTPHGTVYWSTHHSATVANPELFMAYVKEHDAFQLLENRVSKTATKEFVASTGAPPPGVNYAAVRAMNFREGKKDE